MGCARAGAQPHARCLETRVFGHMKSQELFEKDVFCFESEILYKRLNVWGR